MNTLQAAKAKKYGRELAAELIGEDAEFCRTVFEEARYRILVHTGDVDDQTARKNLNSSDTPPSLLTLYTLFNWGKNLFTELAAKQAEAEAKAVKQVKAKADATE